MQKKLIGNFGALYKEGGFNKDGEECPTLMNI